MNNRGTTLTSTLSEDITELLLLWPRLRPALEKDSGPTGEPIVSGAPDPAFRLPVNADVLLAIALLDVELPKLVAWAMRTVGERPAARSVGAHLRRLPSLEDRMMRLSATDEAAHLAGSVSTLKRRVKLALGLCTPDRGLGQFCPLHDDPLSELIRPGDEGVVCYRRDGGPPFPVVVWDRKDSALCRHCGGGWMPVGYLQLMRLLREADARRTEAVAA